MIVYLWNGVLYSGKMNEWVFIVLVWFNFIGFYVRNVICKGI